MLEKKMKRITDEDIIKHSLSSKEFTNLNIRLLDSDTRIEEGDRFEVIFRGIKEESIRGKYGTAQVWACHLYVGQRECD